MTPTPPHPSRRRSHRSIIELSRLLFSILHSYLDEMTQTPGIAGQPIANPDAVVKGEKYRLVVITPGLVRLEYAADGVFENRASTFAINRHFPKPECRFKQVGEGVELVTERMRVSYDGKPFSASGLHVVLLKKSTFGYRVTGG